MVTIRSRLPAGAGRAFMRWYSGDAPARGERVVARVRWGREAVLVLGICWAALGLLVAVWPGKAVSSLEVMFGFALVIGGGVQVFLAAGARFAAPLRALLGLSGVLSVGFAVLCLSGGNAVPMLSMWLGLGWAVAGVSQAIVAVWDDRLADAERHEVVGVATLLTGVVILLLPVESATTLGFVAAAALLLLGGAHVALAGVGREEAHPAWAERVSADRGAALSAPVSRPAPVDRARAARPAPVKRAPAQRTRADRPAGPRIPAPRNPLRHA